MIRALNQEWLFYKLSERPIRNGYFVDDPNADLRGTTGLSVKQKPNGTSTVETCL